MTRLRDKRTGVVVVVDVDTATRLGSAYEPADKQEPKKAPAKRAAKKPSGDN